MVAKKSVQRLGFKTGEHIVYPAHGVGLITAIEEQEVAGLTLELFVISFEQDKLTLRVPIAKIKSVGMRKLAEEPLVKKTLPYEFSIYPWPIDQPCELTVELRAGETEPAKNIVLTLPGTPQP